MNGVRIAFVVGLLGTFAFTGNSAEIEPTYAKDVAPILFQQCAGCHRPDQVGPFSLLTYEDAKKRAKQIAIATSSKIMPPWKPMPGHGEFRDARVLNDKQIATLKLWAEAGAPEGDPKDLPPKPTFKDGWQLGTPDLVLTVPKAFTVPAEGNDSYMHFVFPLDLKKETYLRGIEVLPSNRRVAHHAVGILDSSGTAKRMNAKHGGNGYAGNGGPGFLPAGFTPGYVPGATPRFFPTDSAITLKKGVDFVLQMHYHPTGKEESDTTTVGLYFTDKKPARNVGGLLMGSEDIDIPAGKSDYTVTDSFKLPVDYEFRGIWAHMHLIGKKVRVWAETPDGKTREMLKIDDWDFNWQDTYMYDKSFRLPKGTVLKSEFVFDNSSSNPRNPNTPPKRITLGENSTDEMAGLWIGGLPVWEWDELSIWGAVIGHYFEIAGKGFNAKKK